MRWWGPTLDLHQTRLHVTASLTLIPAKSLASGMDCYYKFDLNWLCFVFVLDLIPKLTSQVLVSELGHIIKVMTRSCVQNHPILLRVIIITIIIIIHLRDRNFCLLHLSLPPPHPPLPPMDSPAVKKCWHRKKRLMVHIFQPLYSLHSSHPKILVIETNHHPLPRITLGVTFTHFFITTVNLQNNFYRWND